jgi:tetratricopeptide (TPR) repeat protein
MDTPNYFFISYNKADRQWAEWIAWTLEEAGYSVVIQAWDFRPGGNFVLEMDRAVGAQKTIAVLSEDYLSAAYTQPEWAAAFANDPQGLAQTLIPIRVRDCKPTGLLRPLIYVDLVELSEQDARQAVLGAMQARAKPPQKPKFPGALPHHSANKVVFPGQITIPWTVLYKRNPYFKGREDELQALRENLLQTSAAALTQPQAISGLGGIGKTQTAVEYAYRNWTDYEAVFWVRADTTLELSRGFVEIAKVLELPQAEAQNEDEAVEAAKRWLGTHPHWLLIFDNADEPERLLDFTSGNWAGHVLLTSRAQDFQQLGIVTPVEMRVLRPEEALAFLLKRTGRETQSNSIECTVAEELALALGYLPLALEQAAAYIVAQQARFQDYLASYRNARLSRLEKAKPQFGNYPESVATTWLLNFQQVAQISGASADLLKFSAFLDPDAIPFELVVWGASQLGETLVHALAGVKEDPLILNEVLTPLRQYSLIRVDRDNQTYSIHRLVQAVLRAEMEPEQRHAGLEEAILAMNEVFPNPEFKNWPLCERLLPHAIALADLEKTDVCEREETGRLLHQMGLYLKERGQYASIEGFYLRSLEILEQQLGKDHPNVAASLNGLSLLYRSQGRYSKAEPLRLRCLEIEKKTLGENHPQFATSLNNLAGLYRSQGRYSEAEPLFVRSLSIRKQQLGQDHPDVAQSLNNLAELYRTQGRYSDAEPLFVQSLEILEQQLGKNHPNVATSLNNLAELYRTQGRYSDAEPLFVRSLEILEHQLWADHPDVASSLNNLAELYKSQGRYSEAEPLFVRSLSIKEQQLGPDHPDVATSLNNLAELYRTQGRYSEAEPLYVGGLRILMELRKQQGFDHPNLQTGVKNFLIFIAQVLQESQQSLLSKHPLTQAAIAQLQNAQASG